MQRLYFLCALLAQVNADSPIWTCEQITYNLCPDLVLHKAQLTVRSLKLVYFRYSSPGAKQRGFPILAINGGPGFDHQHITPLNQIACRGHDVIFYDQVGTGESDRPRNPRATAPWLFTVDYYLEELQAVVDGLELTKFHLLGQSWGTMLGQLYALRHPHAGSPLMSLILSGPLSDGRFYIESQWANNLATLPPFMQKRLRTLSAQRQFDTPEYAAIDSTLTSYFTIRLSPMPDCIAASFADANQEIYVGMQGASEFECAGVLRNFNITDNISAIHVPTLVSHGKYDTMTQPVVEVIAKQIPNSRLITYPHSGHLAVVDDNEMYNNVVFEFVREHDAILMPDNVTLRVHDFSNHSSGIHGRDQDEAISLIM